MTMRSQVHGSYSRAIISFHVGSSGPAMSETRDSRILTGGKRTAMPRHQTLRATLDWSYDLLSESERVILRRLSVFAGAVPLSVAARVVAGEELTEAELLVKRHPV